MRQGTVVNWLEERGYGFIRDDAGFDVFIHHDEILVNKKHKTLVKGQRVEYDCEPSEKGCGRKAVGLVILGGGTKEESKS